MAQHRVSCAALVPLQAVSKFHCLRLLAGACSEGVCSEDTVKDTDSFRGTGLERPSSTWDNSM